MGRMTCTWHAKAETQASKMTHALQKDGVISSVGTFRNIEQSLKTIAQSFKDNKQASINLVTPEQATQYLEDRAAQVGQKALDMERQALQHVLHYNGNLAQKETLQVIKSEHAQVLHSRAYTPEQVREIAKHQTDRNAISTEIAYAAGLRAHELLTIRPSLERPADPRPAHESKFEGREGVSYTVTGKGGLTREIQLPRELSERLEGYRLPEPEKVTDRGIYYERSYNIGGGQTWSASFTRASQNAHGWSNGAHGLRHSYAQERMSEVQREHPRDEALRIVSQEMGHFRPDITEAYLR